MLERVVVVVVPPSFAISRSALILCGGNDDAVSPSSGLLLESGACDIVVDHDC